MKRALLIINPMSGKNKPKSMLLEITDILCQNDCLVTTRLTRKSGDGTEFVKEACKSGNYDLIIACGGDGTLNEVFSGVAMSEKKLPVGYIPCGSTNDYAHSFNIPTDYREAARRVVNGTPNPVDIGRINGRYFNYIASFGLFTAVSYNAPRSLKSMLGHLAYVLEGTKELTKIKSTHAVIETESGIYEDDYIFGAVANSTSIGGIVKLDETLVSFNDGIFEICLVKKPKNPSDILKIIKGAMNSDFTLSPFEFFRASSLKITVPGDLAWSLDGEKDLPGGSVNIDIIHSGVELII